MNSANAGYDLARAAHPGLIIASAGFKIAALSVYALGFVLGYAVRLGIVAVLVSADFWLTKNVLGRKMVGLRWGRIVHPDGAESFYFRNVDEARRNAVDKNFFWGTQGVAAGIWGVLMVFNILSPSKLVGLVAPFSLAAVNLYCFVRCSREQTGRFSGLVAQGQSAAGQLFSAAVSANLGGNRL